jgi:hypothetical protein
VEVLVVLRRAAAQAERWVVELAARRVEALQVASVALPSSTPVCRTRAHVTAVLTPSREAWRCLAPTA